MRNRFAELTRLLALLGLLAALGAAPTLAGQSRETTLRVDGMTCGSCPLTVKVALKKLDGVESVEVARRPAGRAEIVYDPDRVSVEDMIGAIERAGFSASLPEEGS